MNSKMKKTVSVFVCALMIGTLFPTLAFASQETSTPKVETIMDSGKVKLIESAPVVEKVSTTKSANGDVEELYVITIDGTMQVLNNDFVMDQTQGLFVDAVKYRQRMYYNIGLNPTPNGRNMYKFVSSDIQILSVNNGFSLTKMTLMGGGSGQAYNGSGQYIGYYGTTYINEKIATSNISSLYINPNCPYYFEDNTMSGIGTRAFIRATHGTSTFESLTTKHELGQITEILDTISR